MAKGLVDFFGLLKTLDEWLSDFVSGFSIFFARLSSLNVRIKWIYFMRRFF